MPARVRKYADVATKPQVFCERVELPSVGAATRLRPGHRTRTRPRACSSSWDRSWSWCRRRGSCRGSCCRRRSCRSRTWGRCRRWRSPGRRPLDFNIHRRPCLEEAYRRIRTLWRLIRIKSEVIQCPPANRVGVLILREGFAVPCYRIRCLSHSPWSAAITLIIQCAVICPARFLWRCVEADVTDVGSSAQWHAEGLDSAIQVLVVQRVLIVPDPGTWVGDFVTNKRDTIVSWVRLDLFQHGAHARPCR